MLYFFKSTNLHYSRSNVIVSRTRVNQNRNGLLNNLTCCWFTLGRPGFTVIVPTKPLAHWPFRRQTAEWPEVSLEVIYDGLAEDSSVLNQVLWHPSGSRLFLTSGISLWGYFSLLTEPSMGLALIESQLLRRCANLLFHSTLILRYLTPQLLRQCDITFLHCDASYSETQYT